MHNRALFLVAALFLVSSMALLAQASPAQPAATVGTGAAAQGNKPADAAVGAGAGTAVQSNKVAEAPGSGSAGAVVPDNMPAEAPAGGNAEPVMQGNKLAEAPLTNADIVKLSKLELGDDVVIAKISQAKRVNFQVATDDLIGLKDLGVSSGVISAMIRRSSSAVQGGGYVDTPMGAIAVPGMGSGPSVRLDTKAGQFELASIAGHMGTTYAFVTVLVFMDYPGLRADVRTKDTRPSILVTSPKNPAGRYYLAKCEVNDDDGTRSVKMGRSGAFTSSGFGAPDSDWVVNFSAKEEQPGLWRLVPVKDLKPGEYGVWGPGQELFDFGVDK